MEEIKYDTKSTNGNIAEEDLMQFNNNGTNAGNQFATAINSGNKLYYLWTWHNYSEITKIQNNTVTTINSGAPTIINTVESPGDWYIQGHNVGYTLYHYGVIDGYKDNGVSFRYVDPAAGYFGGFIKTQHISGNSMSYAAGGRGYVW